MPLFEVLRLPNDDFPLGRDGQIYHVAGMNFGRAGEQARCVGCHAGHTLLEVPEDPTWINVAPSAEITASSIRRPVSFETLGLGEFLPGNLVDRSTEPRTGEWAARTDGAASVELRWSARVRAREVVVHGTDGGQGRDGTSEQTIGAFHVATFLGETVQQVVSGDGALPGGTALSLDPAREFDTLRLTIAPDGVHGLYEGQSGPALAEIVVTGQLAGEPRGSFVRGDADCDGTVNLSDAMLALLHLFQGGSNLCCAAAADADGNTGVNLTDGVFLLGFLFSAGSAPPSPFPLCAPGTQDGLECDQERETNRSLYGRNRQRRIPMEVNL